MISNAHAWEDGTNERPARRSKATGESTYPEHDCRAPLQTHYHNQDDARWEACGVCGRITAFMWKHGSWRHSETAHWKSAFEEYGDHKQWCARRHGQPECSCGFNAATMFRPVASDAAQESR